MNSPMWVKRIAESFSNRRCADYGLSEGTNDRPHCQSVEKDFWQRLGLSEGDRAVQSEIRDRFYKQRAAWIKEGVPYFEGPDVARLFSEMILDAIQSNDRVLEIGCGTGFLLAELHSALRSRGEARQALIGLDLSDAMLKRAALNLQDYSGTALVRGSVYELPFSSGHFSSVICRAAPYDARKVLNCLRPGGLLFHYDQAPLDFAEIKEAFEDRYTINPRLGGDQWREREAQHLTAAGFCTAEVKEYDVTQFYTRPHLEDMIAMTPLVRDFDPRKDRAILDELESRLSRADRKYVNKIAIKRHYFIVKAVA